MSQVIALIHEQDGRYGISFPDFPGCVSAGATLDEVIARGRDTLAFHVEGMIEDGETIQVRSLDELQRDREFKNDAEGAVLAAIPVDLPGKSVRLNISLDETLLQQIDRAASAAGQSRSGFLADAAKQRIRATA